MQSPFLYPCPVTHLKLSNEITMAWSDEGKGEQTLLFIHGLANYIPVWSHQLSALQHKYRCIAVDLPGNGLSSRGEYPYSISFYADCVMEFIGNLGLKNVILCGHSMGGQIAATIAARNPVLVEKLILIAPAGVEVFKSHEVMMMESAVSFGEYLFSDDSQLETTIHQCFHHTNKEAERIIQDLILLKNRHPANLWKAMSKASIHAILHEPVGGILKDIQCPTLILFGENDQLIPNKLIHFSESPRSIAAQAVAAISQARSVIIPSAGHFVQIEKPGNVNDEIVAFVSKPFNQ